MSAGPAAAAASGQVAIAARDFGCPLCPPVSHAAHSPGAHVFTNEADLIKHIFGTPQVHPMCPICTTKTPFAGVRDLIEHLTAWHLPPAADNTIVGKQALESEEYHCQTEESPILRSVEEEYLDRDDEERYAQTEQGVHHRDVAGWDATPSSGLDVDPLEVYQGHRQDTGYEASRPELESPQLTLTNSYLKQAQFAPFRCVCSSGATFASLFSLYNHQTSLFGQAAHGPFGFLLRRLQSSVKTLPQEDTHEYGYNCDGQDCEARDAGELFSHKEQLWVHQFELRHGGLWHVAVAIWSVQVRSWEAQYRVSDDIGEREKAGTAVDDGQTIIAHEIYPPPGPRDESEGGNVHHAETAARGLQASPGRARLIELLARRTTVDSDNERSPILSDTIEDHTHPLPANYYAAPMSATSSVPATSQQHADSTVTTLPLTQPSRPLLAHSFLKMKIPGSLFTCTCLGKPSLASLKALYNHQTRPGLEHGAFGNAIKTLRQPNPVGKKLQYQCEVATCKSSPRKRAALIKHQVNTHHGQLFQVALGYYNIVYGIHGTNQEPGPAEGASTCETISDEPQALLATSPPPSMPRLTCSSSKQSQSKIRFACDGCSKSSHSLYKYAAHQFYASHGKFSVAVGSIRQSKKDENGMHVYRCDEDGCKCASEDMNVIRTFMHQIAKRHGAIWRVAWQEWKAAWGLEATGVEERNVSEHGESGDLLDLWWDDTNLSCGNSTQELLEDLQEPSAVATTKVG